ncbi:MAG: HDOD domain-containing protein [Gemmatimonadales bacterium]|nr:HDOD domain-containing protein [Gemmatimonadales bacterium]
MIAELYCMVTSSKYFIADLVEEMGSLNAVASQIVAFTLDPECDLDKLTRLIMSDNVMSMRFLALANSVAVSRGKEVRDLRECLIRLGLERVRNVALLMGMHDMAPSNENSANLDMNEFWKHSLATACCAQKLSTLKNGPNPEDAWMVGILHGIGIIALSQQVPEDFQNALLRARALKIPLAEAEMTILEFHHGELGGRILNRWKLPRIFSESVEFHPENFEKQEISQESFAMTNLLLDSIELVRAFGFGDSGDGIPARPLEQVIEDIGLEETVANELAIQVEQEVREISNMLGLDLPLSPAPGPLDASPRKAARLALEGVEDSLAREELEEQLDMAREIQRRLLPKGTPDIPGFSLSAVNHPCHHISGDYFDFINVQGGATGVVIADVSGKGMPASLLASNVQASLRALGQVFPDPGELLVHVNTALFASTDPEHFATLFLAIMDPDGSGFRYASAGHNPPLLLRSDGVVEWLNPAGTPLGMFEEMVYPVTRVAMAPGDLLVAYTDGVTEAMDSREREFTEAGLEQSIRRNRGQDCESILSGVIKDVTLHVKQGENEDLDISPHPENSPASPLEGMSDDLTLLVIRKES